MTTVYDESKRFSRGTVNSVKAPPHNRELEEAVLGGLFLEPAAISMVVGILSNSQVFYAHHHQRIYEGMLSLYEQNRPVDFIGVGEWLVSNNYLDEIGGYGVLTQVFHAAPAANGLEGHAKRVYDYYLLRKAGRILAECQQKAADTSEDVRETISTIEKLVMTISEHSGSSRIQSAKDILTGTYAEIEAAFNAGGVDILGDSTGFPDIDAIINGVQPKKLVYVGGRPGMAKTSLLLQICMLTAKISNRPACFFSLEMSKQELTDRLVSGMSGVESNRMRSGRINPQEMQKVLQAIEDLEKIPLYIDDTASITPAKMVSRIMEVQSMYGEKLVMAGLDYIQLMSGTGKGIQTTNDVLTGHSRTLKVMAGELDTSIWSVSQLSRQLETRKDKHPQLHDLRESGSLEQDADIVIMLYRDEYYDPNSVDRGIAELNLAKQRNGPTGTIKMGFEPQFTRFTNLNSKLYSC